VVIYIKASQGELSVLDQSSGPAPAGRTCARWQPAGRSVRNSGAKLKHSELPSQNLFTFFQ